MLADVEFPCENVDWQDDGICKCDDDGTGAISQDGMSKLFHCRKLV